MTPEDALALANLELLVACEESLEWLYELQGAWHWKATEPRPGYADEYAKLQTHIKDLQELINKTKGIV